MTLPRLQRTGPRSRQRQQHQRGPQQAHVFLKIDPLAEALRGIRGIPEVVHHRCDNDEENGDEHESDLRPETERTTLVPDKSSHDPETIVLAPGIGTCLNAQYARTAA
jgi:hypothetical protein